MRPPVTPLHAQPGLWRRRAVMGVPVEFVLFGLMLLAIAMFHRHVLPIAAVGLLAILAYEGLVTQFPTGTGMGAWFGSSAGVAVTVMHPEARSAWAWLKGARFIPIAYLVGLSVQMLLLGWHPTPG